MDYMGIECFSRGFLCIFQKFHTIKYNAFRKYAKSRFWFENIKNINAERILRKAKSW